MINQENLYQWRPSQISLYMGNTYAMVGITVRTIMVLPLAATLNLLDAVQNVLVIARYPEAVSILRIVGNMMPGIIFHIFAYVRAYHTELSFRIQFSGMKRAQSSIQK
ncbi:hypothetical protein HDU76_008050, partial [Blyttiomyces sp. JEL0837]